MEQDESKVRVMSRSESANYDGVTIEDGNGDSGAKESTRGFNYRTGDFGQIFTVHKLGWRDLLLGQGGWQRALMLVGAVAVLGFLLFVALPVLIVLLGVGVAVWLVMRLFLGR